MKVQAPFVGVQSDRTMFFHLYARAGNKFMVLLGAIVGRRYIDLRLVEQQRFTVQDLVDWYGDDHYERPAPFWDTL